MTSMTCDFQNVSMTSIFPKSWVIVTDLLEKKLNLLLLLFLFYYSCSFQQRKILTTNETVN